MQEEELRKMSREELMEATGLSEEFMLPSDKTEGFSVAPVIGMSLRDYFAAAALHGLISQKPEGYLSNVENGYVGGALPAKAAYIFADAMLAEREKNVAG